MFLKKIRVTKELISSCSVLEILAMGRKCVEFHSSEQSEIGIMSAVMLSKHAVTFSRNLLKRISHRRHALRIFQC
jgi:hypothetical protein